MAALGMGFGAAAAARGRVLAAKAASKSAGGSGEEEKGLLDWILGGLQKDDQLLETDPILKKVEEKSTGTATSRGAGGTTSVSVPSNNNKKPGGLFGGLFAKN